MVSIALVVNQFVKRLTFAFRAFKISHKNLESSMDDADNQAKFKLSAQDLKVVSSALLHYKRFLMQRNEIEKSKKVAELDNRLYQFIVDLENQMLANKEALEI